MVMQDYLNSKGGFPVDSTDRFIPRLTPGRCEHYG